MASPEDEPNSELWEMKSISLVTAEFWTFVAYKIHLFFFLSFDISHEYTHTNVRARTHTRTHMLPSNLKSKILSILVPYWTISVICPQRDSGNAMLCFRSSPSASDASA